MTAAGNGKRCKADWEPFRATARAFRNVPGRMSADLVGVTEVLVTIEELFASPTWTARR
jgi:hypothetical protein